MNGAPPIAAPPPAVEPDGDRPGGEGPAYVACWLLLAAAATGAAWFVSGAAPSSLPLAVIWGGIFGGFAALVISAQLGRRRLRRSAAPDVEPTPDGRLRWRLRPDSPTASAVMRGLFWAAPVGFAAMPAAVFLDDPEGAVRKGAPAVFVVLTAAAAAAMAAIGARRSWRRSVRGENDLLLDPDRRTLTLPRSAVRATIRDGRFIPLRSPKVRGANRDLPFDRIAAVEHDRVVLPFSGKASQDGPGVFLRLREPHPDGDERRILLVFQSDSGATPARNVRLVNWLRGELGSPDPE